MAPNPATKKVKKRQPPVIYTEPKRKSLLDIINENMTLAKRNIFIHRLIYIGRHSFSPGELNNISEYFQNVIDSINSRYCDEYLTGFLLHYPTYFCHVLEGSELSLKKHFLMIFTDPEMVEHIYKPKILVVYHHINQRFLNVWTHLTAKPPTLLEKIDITADLENTTAKVIHCVQKLYKLGYTLRAPIEDSHISSDSSFTNSSKENESISSPQVSFKMINKVKSTMTSFEDIGRPSDALPEYSLLEFLTESPYVRDLQDYINSFGCIPVIQSYEDKSWPASVDYVPKNVFDSEYDPVTDLPSKEQEEDPDMII